MTQAALATDAPLTNMTPIIMSLIAPGRNPRKFFDPIKMTEMEASIREKGVLQPILVRPIEGGFEIIAGERRYRAALKVYGEEGNIPAVVQEMSDQEAEEAALVENTIRDDMSPTEEAVAAGKMLEHHNGNREETAAVLGWPISKLTRRLALLNLTEEVMTALNERKILVGHAELLAACPQEKQNKALENIMSRNLTVQQVRDLLVKVTTEFSKAIFETGVDCLNCQHNSTKQADLFSTTVEAGRCTNQDCFKKHTAEKIASIKAQVEEEFPNVRLIEVGDPANYVAIAADGDLGVGLEQYAACKGCGNYGATVSSIPGSEGKVEKDICFDAACHQKKVAARIKEQNAAAGSGETKTTPSTTKPTADKGKTKAKAGKKAAVSSVSEKVKEYRRKKVWNLVAENELRLQPGKAASFLLDLMLTSNGSKVSGSKLAETFQTLTGDDCYQMGKSSGNGHPDKAFALDPEQKRQMFTEAAATTVSQIEEGRVKNLLTFLCADLGNHWKVDEDFLTLLTKSEIEAVCTDIGLAATMPEFKKVIGGKKDEAIKAIVASGFDFTGKVPTLLVYADPATAEGE